MPDTKPAAPPVAEEATVTCPNSSLELKRCPKCEGKNVCVTCLDPGDGLPPYWVECDDCGIRTSVYRRYDTAANNWNQRATPSPTREAEVELPSIDLTEDDWGTAIDSVDSQDFPSSTGEAVKLACRERQLREAIARIAEIEAELAALKAVPK